MLRRLFLPNRPPKESNELPVLLLDVVEDAVVFSDGVLDEADGAEEDCDEESGERSSRLMVGCFDTLPPVVALSCLVPA